MTTAPEIPQSPWFIEVTHPMEPGIAYSLVEHQDNPRACTLLVTVDADQDDDDVVTSRIVGHIFAPPRAALALLRRAGMVIRDSSDVLTSSDAEDKQTYYETATHEG